MKNNKSKYEIKYQWQSGKIVDNTKKGKLEHLELFSKIIGVITVIAIVVGGINIYAYLQKINHLFLFPEVVGLSYASMSALVTYFLFVLLIGTVFYFPFFSHTFLLSINNLGKDEKKYNKNNRQSKPIISVNPKWLNFIKYLLVIPISFILTILLIIIPLLPMLLFFIIIPVLIIYKMIENIFFYEKSIEIDILSLSKFVHYGFFYSALIFNVLFFTNVFLNIKYIIYIIIFTIFLIFLIYNYKFIKIRKDGVQITIYFDLIFFSLIQTLPFLLHFTILLPPTISLVNNLYYGLGFYVVSIFIFGFSSYLSHITFSDYFKDKKHSKYAIIANILPVFFYVILISFFSNYELSLYKTRFIEKPQNSSWYLIHNGNTTSDTINGIAQDDIKQRKVLFNAKSCEFSLGRQYKEKCDDDNQVLLNEKDTLNQRTNALYGYMAWNLGNTKVFCPVSVDFFDNKDDNKEKSAKCLTIDGKYLQPITTEFLSK